MQSTKIVKSYRVSTEQLFSNTADYVHCIKNEAFH